MPDRVRKVKREIRRLSEDEQDPPVRKFFKKLSKLQDNLLFEDVLIEILDDRPEISEEHLPYLIYVSLQYLTDFSYDKPQSKTQLEEDIKLNRDRIIHLCQHKNVSTNVTERYFHLQIILEIINKPVVLADLGSSLGIGLQSLNTDRFSAISLHPRLEQYWNNDAKIETAIGIDIQRPDPSWAKACYLPENAEDRNKINERVQTLNENQDFEFVQGDILCLDQLNLPKFDVVWTSNVLYQIEGDRNTIENSIRSVMSEYGIWINADYRYDDEDFTGTHNPYVSQVRRMEDWDDQLEVLESPSDVVEVVRPGNDFERFESQYVQ